MVAVWVFPEVLLRPNPAPAFSEAVRRKGERSVADIVAIKRSEPPRPVAATTDRSILRLVLANPPANALSRAVIDELQAALDAARERPGRARHRAGRHRQAVLGRP